MIIQAGDTLARNLTPTLGTNRDSIEATDVLITCMGAIDSIKETVPSPRLIKCWAGNTKSQDIM